jgi:hypothetical protein
MLRAQGRPNSANCFARHATWRTITATLASNDRMVMLESRMPGQLACPVWRGLGGNVFPQGDNTPSCPVMCSSGPP